MIRINNISKTYGNTIALSDISFNINKGEIVGLLGVNGAGKSTLMKILSGIIAPDSGTVNIMDNDLSKNPIEIKKHIGYLSENNPLYEDMYVLEYINYVAQIYDVDRSRLESFIHTVGLEKEATKKIGSLSKGNRQRVGIAQAILHNPDFLILDEPSNGLDPNQRKTFNDLFVELSEDKAILFSTHQFQEVQDICTRYILIHQGKIVADKAKSEINAVKETFYILTNEDSSR